MQTMNGRPDGALHTPAVFQPGLATPEPKLATPWLDEAAPQQVPIASPVYGYAAGIPLRAGGK